MTSETSSLHLIGDNGELQSQEGMMTFFESALAATGSPTNTVSRSGTSHVKRCGTKYHVVAVFGGQSSGKSTLLNNVFGTRFETMEESTGRQQTTKGAFLARYQDREAAGEAEHRNPSELFVMDFEGTDGMERGEDQSFERQLSLFALSVADVLVINMWANDVGRYNAANMSLLRTIFEVNLQLFAHDSYLKEEKPTLLIVLRDFTEVDLQKYADIVMKSLNKTWESITKPEGFENHEITNLFHVRFHGLPHYKLQRADFDEEVKNFRRWFLDTLSPKYLFKSIVSYRHIPLEALPSYFDNCWASIQGSRDLDIPTQRDLVARHRCTELFDAAVAAFKIVTDEQAANIKAGKLQPQLEAALHHAADAATADFDLQTKLYSRKVVADAARKLEVALETGIKDVVEQHTAKLVEECMRHVDDDVQSIVDDAFRQLHSNKKLLEGQATPADALPLVKTFWSDIALRITELEDRLASGNYAEAYGKYSDLVTQDNASLERSAAVVADTIIERVRQRIASMAADACTTMTKAFDFVLTHKEDGSLRFFSTTTGLQTVFPRARFAGLVVLGCIFFMRLKRGLQRTESALGENRDEKRFYLSIPSYQEGDVVVQYPELSILSKGTDSEEETDGDEKLAGTHVSMIDPKYILMNKAAVRRAFDLYSQQIQFSMQMQLRTIESSQQSAPTWVWVAMLVLGHNEFLYVATSPVLLLFTIIVVYMFFSQWVVAQWHRFEETGPTGVVLAVKSVIALVEPHVRSLQSRAPPKAEADADAAASAKKHD